ncbi:MAG TPA: hypothetical protein VFM18_17420 [Methanosarcina sp.]|nr:hypothetical protein [Methanosarcina sp.]
MALDDFTVCKGTQRLWRDWESDIKHSVPDFGFKDYIVRVQGFTYEGTNESNFKFIIKDEQKFTLFVLKYC